jgi:hypothetical protein
MASSFRTLPWIDAVRLHSIASMMSAPYSRLRLVGIGLSPRSIASIDSSFSRRQRGQLLA